MGTQTRRLSEPFPFLLMEMLFLPLPHFQEVSALMELLAALSSHSHYFL